MQVKIDTRQNFHAITITEKAVAANMTAELDSRLLPLLQHDVRNVVLNLKDIESMDNAAAEYLVKTQQLFYDHNASFVICELQRSVEEKLDQSGLLEIMNITPTESEAADVISMEAIERDLLDEEEV
jgi:anti-anti-sigma factor